MLPLADHKPCLASAGRALSFARPVHHPMQTRIFRVHSDPGHAWVKVPKAFLARIIGEHWRSVFTPFSYERGEYVYLEEDEDASRFVNWCRTKSIEPVFKSASTGAATKYSRIRTYSPLSPT